jgi:beta-phosphoglucomutase-like phosphatase (HAD superfamily)
MLGLLFDLDGTLALTNALHEHAWRDVLAQYGVALSKEDYVTQISGRSNPEIVSRLLPGLSSEAGVSLAEGKEGMFRRMVVAPPTLPGLFELVQRASVLGCKLAVVTNAPHANALHVLHTLGLMDKFHLVVAAEHVSRAKPDPQPYAQAARKLGLTPEQCIAFEDSPSGVKAAVAAGIPVAGLLSGHSAAELLTAGADVVAQDFTAAEFLTWVGRRFALLNQT